MTRRTRAATQFFIRICQFLQVRTYETNSIIKSFSKKQENEFIWVKQVNPIQYGPFQGCSRMGAKRSLPKIWHTYPMMKTGAAISYLKTIKKTYRSRDTPLEFYWCYIFSHRKSATFVILRNADIDFILMHNFYFFKLFLSI